MTEVEILKAIEAIRVATWDAARFLRYAERSMNPGIPPGLSIANKLAMVEDEMRSLQRRVETKLSRHMGGLP